MSLREEDRQKNACPSRGLGLAAAAIGVGVGAALYYLFSKRPENPASEGATSQQWNCETRQTFIHHYSSPVDVNDSYTTVSEHTTTDTSINEDSHNNSDLNNTRNEDINTSNDSVEPDDLNEPSHHPNISICSSNTSSIDINSYDSIEPNESSHDSDTSSVFSISSDDEMESTVHDNSSFSMLNDSDESLPVVSIGSSSDLSDWEVETSSGVPSAMAVHRCSPLEPIFADRLYPSNRPLTRDCPEANSIRAQVFRERSWSLEECSICFEVILRDQKVMSLPCTHHFHEACITPWLQEQQTCPNCRNAIVD